MNKPVGAVAAAQVRGASIAIDGRYLARPGMGINRYVTGLVETLIGAGVQVTVLTGPTRPVTVDSAVTVVTLGGERQMAWEQVHLLRHLRRHHYDLYWAPANGGVPLLAPRRQRVLVTQHDLIPILRPSGWFPRSVLWGVAYFIALFAAIIRADAVVTVSCFSAKMIRRLFGRRALVVPPVIRPVRRSEIASAVATTDPYVLYHGGLSSWKRVDSVIAACAVLRDRGLPHRLVLLGRGYEAFDELIATLDLEKQVIRPGFVPDAERDRWVAHAHCVVYPSEMEGFGLPLLEAMNLGVPVVTGRNSSLVEVGGRAALYASPDSPEQIADCITELGDPARRRAAIDAGYGQCRRFSHENAAAATVALIADQLGRR